MDAMPNNLDLGAIKDRAKKEGLLGLIDSLNLIADVERLRQELATAKKIGAAEELDALYYQVENLGHWEVQALLEKRAAELRAEVGE
jgi:hypothetical protein